MPTFGPTGNSASSVNASNDRSRVSSATPSSGGKLTKLTARVSLNSAGSTVAKAVVYADSGGSPGALLATGDEVTVNWTTEAATDFPFSGANQINLVSGTQYWIGLIFQDPGTPTFQFSCDTTANGHWQGNDTYSDGPANPHPLSSQQTGILDCYGTYTDAVTGTGASTFGFSTAGQGREVFRGSGASAFGFSTAGSGISAEDVTGSGGSTFGFSTAGTGVSAEDVTGAGGSAFGFAVAGQAREVFRLQGASAFGFSTEGEGTITPPIPPRDYMLVNWARKQPLERVIKQLLPVGYWRLGEAEGPTAHDHAGGHHGNYVGSPTLGVTGGLSEDPDTALALNGTSQYIGCGSAGLDLGDAFSVVALVKRGPTGAARAILSKGEGGYYVRLSATGAVEVRRSGVATITTATVVLDDEWHVVFAGKSGSDARIEVDGEDVTGAITNSTLVNTTNGLKIGVDEDTGGTRREYSNATLDEVALFDRLLTRKESARVAAAFLLQEFGGPYDDIAALAHGGWKSKRGRNAGRSSDMIGQLTIRDCDDGTGFFTASRNLASNPDFHAGIDDWETDAISGLTAAATWLRWAADPYPGAGTRSARASLSATLNSGFYLPLPGTYRDGIPISVEAALRSYSGNTNVQVGIASSGAPADIAGSAGTIAAGYGLKGATLTPSVDRDDLVVFVRTTTAAAAEIGIARVQVNIGDTVYTWVFGPSKPMLKAGAKVLWYYRRLGVDYPRFHGIITGTSREPGEQFCTITCQDPRRSHDVNVSVTAEDSTGRDYRHALIDEAIRVVEGSYTNLAPNPSFEDGLGSSNWTLTGGAALSSAWAADGSNSILIPVGGSAGTVEVGGRRWYEGRFYRATITARRESTATQLIMVFGDEEVDSRTESGEAGWPALMTDGQEYSVVWRCPSDRDESPTVRFFVTGGSGVYIDKLIFTEGIAYREWIPAGVTRGRQPNYARAQHQSPEATPNWKTGWRNLIGNPEAVTNTNGWSPSTNGLITVAGGVIARAATALGPLATHFTLTTSAPGQGMRDSITETLYGGHEYRILAYVKPGGSAAWKYRLGVGSAGTPSDKAETVDILGTDPEGWYEVLYVPLADRTDAAAYLVDTSAAAGGAIEVSGFFLHAGEASQYAREGFNLLEAASIESLLGEPRGATITTYAVAGSGAILETAALAGPGIVTAGIRARLVSGGPDIRFGIGDPYGDSADDEEHVVTLTSSWQELLYTWEPTRLVDPLDRLVHLLVRTPSATAIEFEVAEPLLIPGVAWQPYTPLEAAGIDAGETDVLPAVTIADQGALGEASNLNAINQGAHWIEPLLVRPFWRYKSRARRSLADKTVAYVIDDRTAIIDLGEIEQDLDAMTNAVVVAHTGGQAAASSTDPPNDTTYVVTEIDGEGYLDKEAAEEVASYVFRRDRGGQLTPYVTVSEANIDLLLSIEIDQLNEIDSRRARIRDHFLVTRLEEDVSAAGLARTLELELETFVV